MCLAVHRGVQLGEGVSNEMTNFMGLTGLDRMLGGKGGETREGVVWQELPFVSLKSVDE
nr:hypothetical protein I308_00138 [Cryptococcus tetragattii IND107]